MRLNGWGLVSAVIIAAIALLTNCAGLGNPFAPGNEAYFPMILVNATGDVKEFRVQTRLKAVLNSPGQKEVTESCPTYSDDLLDTNRTGRCTVTVSDPVTGEFAGGTFPVGVARATLIVATRDHDGQLELDDETRFEGVFSASGQLITIVDKETGARLIVAPSF